MTRRAIVVLGLALAAPACSGGKHSHQTPVSIPAPTNLVASGGFESVSLSWSPVAGATGYELFRVRDPGVPWVTGGEAPIAVSGTTYTIPGLRNWVETSWRVAAVIGGKTGVQSTTASATPNGGWLVGFRLNTGELAARYRSDIPGDAPSDALSGAKHAATLGGNGPVVYELPAVSPYTEIGLYKSGATRVTVAATANHVYSYYGETTTGRWLYSDKNLGTGTWEMHTNDFAGGDDRTLVSGCTTSPVSVAFARGVLVECTTTGTTDTVWASDGIAAGRLIPGTSGSWLLKDYFPEGAILSQGGLLYTAPVDGSAAPVKLTSFTTDVTDSGDAYATGVVGTEDTIVFVTNVGSGAQPFHLWAMGPDGAHAWLTPEKSTTTPSFFLDGVSTDSRHFLVLEPGVPGSGLNQIYRLGFLDNGDLLNFSPSASDYEAHFLADDSVVIRASLSAKWRLYAPGKDATNSTAATVNNVGVTSSFLGTRGPWMLFNDQSTGVTNLTSVNENLATLNFISTNLLSNSQFTWGIDGSDFAYLTNDGAVHLGTPDNSRSALLDPAQSNGLEPSGLTSDGREFWIVTHVAGDDDTVSLDAAGAVTKILGGATSDAGWYVP